MLMTLSETVIELIKQKRSWSDADIQQFRTPTKDDLRDPLLLENITEFITTLHTYTDKTITIVPDYDADGILSGSLLSAALSVFGFNRVNVYTPRIQTGYGITKRSAKEVMGRFPDTEVIITTDNGSNAFDGIHYVEDLGVKVLVTDHHKAGDIDPTPLSVNPNRPSDRYLFKGISGTAVVWKVMQAYAKQYGDERQQRLIDHLIVLVGISTISDVMPLLDENRYIVQTAVNRLQDKSFLHFGSECDGAYGAVFRGLLALHNVCDDNKKFDYGFDEMTLGFVFGPMLNSPRRMSGSSKTGFALFMNESYDEALTSALSLFGTNEERKRLMRHYGPMYLSPVLPAPNKLDYLVGVAPIQHGLIGLLAGQFTSRFDLPSVVLTGDHVTDLVFDGQIDSSVTPTLSGSGRSPEWFDLHGHLTEMSEQFPKMFKKFGGHAQAAGVEVYTDHYLLFRQEFQRRVEAVLHSLVYGEIDPVKDDVVWLGWGKGSHTKQDVAMVTERDVLALTDVLDFIESLKPFGQGFHVPKFGVSFSTDDVQVSFMGADQQHVKFTCPNGLVLLEWNGADALRQQLGHLSGPFRFEAIGELSLNEFRDMRTMQVIIDQLRIVE